MAYREKWTPQGQGILINVFENPKAADRAFRLSCKGIEEREFGDGSLLIHDNLITALIMVGLDPTIKINWGKLKAMGVKDDVIRELRSIVSDLKKPRKNYFL